MTKKRFNKLLMSQGISRDTVRGLNEEVKRSNDFVCEENHALRIRGNDFRFIPTNYRSFYDFTLELRNL
jgi:hypothetical protein